MPFDPLFLGAYLLSMTLLASLLGVILFASF